MIISKDWKTEQSRVLLCGSNQSQTSWGSRSKNWLGSRRVRRPTTVRSTDRREHAQRFLRDTLAGRPKSVTAVAEAATKAHVDPQALEQARADLGVVTSREGKYR